MKLVPITNPSGNSTVSPAIKFTLLSFELFCNPIINKTKKHVLNDKITNNFLSEKSIYLKIFNKFISNYK
tara:strand:- start:661 stop:870 length:210 start_codon:yes stop_codon:yes gene_type:complete